MTTKAQQSAKKDISDRLDKIAFHFEEQSRFRVHYDQFIGKDFSPDSPRSKELERFRTRVQSEELSVLIELVHLRDNVIKYFHVHKMDVNKLKKIEKCKPYKIAANFVNVHKHGSRGRNRPVAKIDYETPIFIRKGKKP